MSSSVSVEILWNGWFFGKHLSTMCRNIQPRLVLTFELKGGLCHVMFLVRFLLFFRAFSRGGLYVNLTGRIRFLLDLSAKGQWMRQILLC